MLIRNRHKQYLRFATLVVTLLIIDSVTVAAHGQSPLDEGAPSVIERDLVQRFRDAGANVETWDNGNIRALILNANFGDADMPVVAGLANLHWLNLSGTNVTDRGLNTLRPLTQLRGISLSGHITDKGVEVLRVFTDLEHLSFEDCKRVTDRGFAHVGQLHKLTDVNTPINISDESMRQLGTLRALQTIHLKGLTITDHGLQHLAHATKLRTLVLPPAVTGSGLSHLRGSTGLSTILLSRATTDEGVRQLASFPEVTRVDLRSCSAVTSTGVAPLRALPNLRSISLGPSATDETIRDLTTFPALTQIELSLADVTDACVASLTQVPQLESLQISNKIRVEALSKLSSIKTLKSLTLMGEFSDDVVPVLLQFDHVATLTLHNSNVSEAGIKQLQEHRFPLGIHLLVSRR
jgi:hypothetical protein